MPRYYRIADVQTYGNSSSLVLDNLTFNAATSVEVGPLSVSLGAASRFTADFGVDTTLTSLAVRGPAQSTFPRSLTILESDDGNLWNVRMRVADLLYLGGATVSSVNPANQTGDLATPVVRVQTIPTIIGAVLDNGFSTDSVYFAIDAPVTTTDDYEGGFFKIEGTVAVKSAPVNFPLQRKVVLIEERSERVIRSTWSDPVTGQYRFASLKHTPGVRYTVMAYDYAGNFKAVVEDNVEPVPL